MDNWKELKEVKEHVQIQESEKLAKYGLDFQKELEKTIKKRQNPRRVLMRKIIKKSSVYVFDISILLIIIFSYFIIAIPLSNLMTKNRVSLKSEVENIVGGKVGLIVKDVDINNNGIYVYKIKEIPQIRVHATKNYTKLENDGISRINKYFFEKWEDSEKHKFIVKEEFIESSVNDERANKWLINYTTCIEVNNYNELMNATEAIIRLKEFAGKWDTSKKHQIKFANKIIIPNNKQGKTNEEIRQEAKNQYIQIIKENNLNATDIPKEEM